MMSDDSAYRKILRLMRRGRDGPKDSVEEFIDDKLLIKKDEYLIENGAYLFKELVKSSHGKNNSLRIFSLKELQKATDNFSANLIFIGPHPLAYRGIIEDRHVAVKRCGVNEVISLSLIKHRNVVKLLGCCLETKDIILVHELPPNGTLREYIFRGQKLIPPPLELSWTDRLRIATEIADALSHLHSEQLHITHGRLKADEAVLLDEFLSAKLGAFDFSEIQNQAESSDVETNNIRNKRRKRNDVYYFGSILLNLLGIYVFSEVQCYDKVEILKYVKMNVSEKEMPQIEAYIDLLLRCRSWHGERWDLLSLLQQYERMKKVVGEDELSIEEVVGEYELSIEEVARDLRRIRSM